ncbi:MAG: alpha-amylase, partial [Prevotellaceae bacterium]|nr:alpha-amylase [Prevotellaceae bacterium]
MKRLFSLSFSIFVCLAAMAQGWPEKYQGVMLQGFSWDSYADTQWSNIESQSDVLAEYFSLLWVPNSGNCNSPYGLA